MANISEVAQLAFNQIFPNGGDETPIDREEFVATAQSIYANAVWILSKQEKREEGVFNLPSYLLSESKIEVVDNEADISELLIMRSINEWLQNIGGLTCTCQYLQSTVNRAQLLCDDEFQEGRTYIVIGNKIKFPEGVHVTPLPIIYVNDGTGDDVNIDESLAKVVREQLVMLYSKKGIEDSTNNSNSNS